MDRRPKPLLDRFLSKVEKSSGCWLWHGATNGRYGLIAEGAPSRKLLYAHRVSHELFVGPISAGTEIDHLCRNPLCVNPAHIEAVTRRENQRRGVGIIAKNIASTACPRGHRYDTVRDGQRRCSTCDRKLALDSYYRRKPQPGDLSIAVVLED